jgi:hypothetical protein
VPINNLPSSSTFCATGFSRFVEISKSAEISGNDSPASCRASVIALVWHADALHLPPVRFEFALEFLLVIVQCVGLIKFVPNNVAIELGKLTNWRVCPKQMVYDLSPIGAELTTMFMKSG